MISSSIKQFSSKVTEQNFKEFLVNLKGLVKQNFVNNPSILYIKPLEDDTVTEQGIDYNIKVLPSFQKKPLAD